MDKLLGFAPDAQATTPGVITDCSQLVPTLTGMEGAPSAVAATSVPVLADECTGAAVLRSLDDTRRFVVGTDAALYELLAGAWTDYSDTGGYTGGADTRWSFAQFGNTALASNKKDTMQRSTGTGFAAIAGGIKAEVVFSTSSFVMALNVNDGTEKQDGWHCSAAFDETDWTEAIATQCTSGRLVASPGALTAGMSLGEYAVAYKSKSIYLGQYVGAPVVWDWILVPGGEAGCVGKEAICDIGGIHFFVGEDNFWLFDGTRPQPIADNVIRQWYFENSNPAYRYLTIAQYDRQNNRVYVFYAASGSLTLDSTLVWHVKANKWGRANQSIEAAVNYVEPGLTIDGMSNVSATIDGLPSVAYDSQFWQTGGRSMSVFDTSHQCKTLTGVAGTSSFTTGDMGDDDAVTRITRLRLRYESGRGPTTATVQTYKKMNSGDDFTDGPLVTAADGKFDLRCSGRWHRAKFTFTGDVRVDGMVVSAHTSGRR